MFRYRIARSPSGRHIVLPALAAVVSLEETYATRGFAQETADWLNRLQEEDAAPLSFEGAAAVEGVVS